MLFQHATNELRVTVSADLFPQDVVFKCFYWYGHNFSIDIDHTEQQFVITLTPKNGSLDADAMTALENKVRTDLVDFKTRSIVAQETKIIRELLVAKALSNLDDALAEPDCNLTEPAPDAHTDE